MRNLIPDIVARIKFRTTEDNGRRKPLPAKQFGCPLIFERAAFDCRLLLDQTGELVYPGEVVEIPVKFLFPQLIKPRLQIGSKFKLWDTKDFADGEVIEIL